jgi:outer membrane protein TolC
LDTAQVLLDSSLTRVEAGLAVETDQLSARAYLAERHQDLIAARGGVAVGWAELEAAIGDPIPPDQRSLAAQSVRTFESGSVELEAALALKTRPDRTSLTLQSASERVALRSAQSALGPQVNAFGTWETDRRSIVGSGGDNWTAGVEIRIDLIPAAKRENLAVAKIAINRAKATQAAADREITLQVTRAFYEHQAAAEMLSVAQASVSQTEESLRTLQDRYAAGLATMTDLLRAEDAERRSHATYEQAVSRNAVTYAALKFADGSINQDIAGDLQ